MIKIRTQPTERQEQIKVITYLEMLKRNGKILFYYAIPNGGSRNAIEAKNLKSEGVRAGVSDLCIILPNKTLYVEMKKRPKILKSGKTSIAGIKVSDAQKDFIEAVTKNEHIEAKVCFGFDEAVKFVDSHINEKKQKKDPFEC